MLTVSKQDKHYSVPDYCVFSFSPATCCLHTRIDRAAQHALPHTWEHAARRTGIPTAYPTVVLKVCFLTHCLLIGCGRAATGSLLGWYGQRFDPISNLLTMGPSAHGTPRAVSKGPLWFTRILAVLPRLHSRAARAHLRAHRARLPACLHLHADGVRRARSSVIGDVGPYLGCGWFPTTTTPHHPHHHLLRAATSPAAHAHASLYHPLHRSPPPCRRRRRAANARSGKQAWR